MLRPKINANEKAINNQIRGRSAVKFLLFFIAPTCNRNVASNGKFNIFIGAFFMAESLIDCLGTIWIFDVSKAPGKIEKENYIF